jgi:hypothetical protein
MFMVLETTGITVRSDAAMYREWKMSQTKFDCEQRDHYVSRSIHFFLNCLLVSVLQYSI